MPARVLPKGRCSQRCGGRPTAGRPTPWFPPLPAPQEPGPSPRSPPGIPQAPLHGAESRPHPLTEALGEFKHLRSILHRPERHPSGEPPTRWRPRPAEATPSSQARLRSAVARRPLGLTLPLTFSGASLSLNFLSPAPPPSLPLRDFCRTTRIQRKATSLLSCIAPFRGLGWVKGHPLGGRPGPEASRSATCLGLQSPWRGAIHLPRGSHLTAPLHPLASVLPSSPHPPHLACADSETTGRGLQQVEPNVGR